MGNGSQPGFYYLLLNIDQNFNPTSSSNMCPIYDCEGLVVCQHVGNDEMDVFPSLRLPPCVRGTLHPSGLNSRFVLGT